MKLVHMVMALTPYGILALITKVVAGSDAADILNLLTFIVASYLAIAIMFGVHAGLLTLSGTNVLDYFRKVWPVLTFAFTSTQLCRHHSSERGDPDREAGRTSRLSPTCLPPSVPPSARTAAPVFTPPCWRS